MHKGVSMNKISLAFLLAVLVGFAHGVVCMNSYQPLSQVEKEVFLRKVAEDGIESISNQLAQMKAPESGFFSGSDDRIYIRRGVRMHTPFVLTFDIWATDSDPLAILIQKVLKNNLHADPLGKYTTWCKMIGGGYFEVTCTFNDKRVLEKILNELKENK